MEGWVEGVGYLPASLGGLLMSLPQHLLPTPVHCSHIFKIGKIGLQNLFCFLIEVKCTQQKPNHLTVYNSGVFWTLTICHLCLVPRHSHHPQKRPPNRDARVT